MSALARPANDRDRHAQVRAAMRSAHGRNNPIRIPSAILVELYRGKGFDEPIDRVLGQGFARVVTTGARVARIAGHLLANSGAGSEMAIDAMVVATAIRFGGGMILTHDPQDLQRLAANHRNVAVVGI